MNLRRARAVVALFLALAGAGERSVRVAASEAEGGGDHPHAPAAYLPAVFNRQGAPEGRIRLTFDSADETQPALSPDGRTVVHIRSENGQAEVYRYL
jgi:hypothetical protein